MSKNPTFFFFFFSFSFFLFLFFFFFFSDRFERRKRCAASFSLPLSFCPSPAPQYKWFNLEESLLYSITSNRPIRTDQRETFAPHRENCSRSCVRWGVRGHQASICITATFSSSATHSRIHAQHLCLALGGFSRQHPGICLSFKERLRALRYTRSQPPASPVHQSYPSLTNEKRTASIDSSWPQVSKVSTTSRAPIARLARYQSKRSPCITLSGPYPP